MVEDEELLIDEEGNILPRGNEDNEISKENNPAINTDKGNVQQSEDKKEKRKINLVKNRLDLKTYKKFNFGTEFTN